MIKKLLVMLLMYGVFGHIHAEPLAIIDFSVETIETLDSEGKVIASVPVSSLPETAIVVIEKNEELDLVAIKDTSGEVVWLDTYYVKLNQGKVVDLPCYKIGTTGAQDRRETGTMGFGGTCEDAN